MTSDDDVIRTGVQHEWLECITCNEKSEIVKSNCYLNYHDKGGGNHYVGDKEKRLDGATDYFVKYSTFLLCHSRKECLLKHRREKCEDVYCEDWIDGYGDVETVKTV